MILLSRDQSAQRLLGSLVELNRRRAPETQIVFNAQDGFFEGLPEREGMELLRIVQEALTNARRHSEAGTVRVALRAEGDELVAEVQDDGRGFDAEAPAGVGLRSMRERAAALGGELEVHSEPGEGTLVRLRMARPPS